MQTHRQVERVEVERVGVGEQRGTVFVGIPAYLHLVDGGRGAEGGHVVAYAVFGVGRGGKFGQGVFPNIDMNHHLTMTNTRAIYIACRHVVVAIFYGREDGALLEGLAAVYAVFKEVAVEVHLYFDGRRVGRTFEQAVRIGLLDAELGRYGQVAYGYGVGEGRAVGQALAAAGLKEGEVAVAVFGVVGRIGGVAQAEVGELVVADAEPAEATVGRPRLAIDIGLGRDVDGLAGTERAIGRMRKLGRKGLQGRRLNLDAVFQTLGRALGRTRA